ncbi:MAG TPA: hypothetical protein VIK06_04645 [Candidatus Limnocylindrales bacterium]|jgi:hypothetical protein
MTRDREWWLAELNFALSCFAALMAVLMVFAAIDGISLAIRDTANGDRIAEAIAWTLVTPVHWVDVPFAQFFLASFLGFRLLVPTFAGAPPRTVALIVVTGPLAFAGLANYGNVSSALWFGAIGVSWALIMPLPSKSLLVYGPVVGGIIAGLAFSSFSFAQPKLGLEAAIVWCAWRLYRRHLDEVAATAIAAAFVPAVLAAHDLPAGRFTGAAVLLTTEVAILLALATAALVFSDLRAEPTDTAADE